MAVEPAIGERASEYEASREVDWDRVYAEQLPRVYNFLRFRVANRADVEDLTSRTFEKAWQSRERYKRDLAQFSTWLFTIARNVAVDHLRSKRDHLPLDSALELPIDRTPEHDAMADSNLLRLAKLTGDLPDRERELLALKYGAAINNRQIAELTGLSESNVGTILSRTVEILRTRW